MKLLNYVVRRTFIRYKRKYPDGKSNAPLPPPPIPFGQKLDWHVCHLQCRVSWDDAIFFSLFRSPRLVWIYFLAVTSLQTFNANPLKNRMSRSIDKSLSSVFEESKGCYPASKLSRGFRGYSRADRLKGRSPQWKRNPELTLSQRAFLGVHHHRLHQHHQKTLTQEVIRSCTFPSMFNTVGKAVLTWKSWIKLVRHYLIMPENPSITVSIPLASTRFQVSVNISLLTGIHKLQVKWRQNDIALK